ncbi:MAG TPA: hypothetical protein VIJ20_04045 [Solirubrobacteraceae bacterium]
MRRRPALFVLAAILAAVGSAMVASALYPASDASGVAPPHLAPVGVVSAFGPEQAAILAERMRRDGSGRDRPRLRARGARPGVGRISE